MEPGVPFVRPWGMDGVSTDRVPRVRARHHDFDAFYGSCWHEVYRPLAVTLRDVDNQQGWVYRVALNWATSRLRKTRREVRSERVVDRPVAWAQPDLDLFDALGSLDLKHRAVVVLRYLLDWSESEIAEALDVPNGTVKSRLHRALGKLREELS